MTASRRIRFVSGTVAWMLLSIIILALLNSLSIDLFFILSLIGFLIVVELSAPFSVQPKWRRRLWVVIAIGILIFMYIAGKRIFEIIEPGTLS